MATTRWGDPMRWAAARRRWAATDDDAPLGFVGYLGGRFVTLLNKVGQMFEGHG